MIPTNKIKKLVLQCILKFIDSEHIWEDCSLHILVSRPFLLMFYIILLSILLNLQETTENLINPLQVKEIFCKEILPDLSYNNFGYDNEIIEKLKRLSKKLITKPLHFDSKLEHLTETIVDNTSNGSSSINWIEVDRDIYNTDADLHSESLVESAEEEEDNESELDTSIKAILKKYTPDRVYSTQGSVCCQESEKLYSFRESQLQNVFDDAESDPLTNNSNTDNSKYNSNYDVYDYLCDGGRLSEVFIHSKPSTSLESTADRSVPLKRKSNSVTDTNFDKTASKISSPKQSRLSNSMDADYFPSFSEAETNRIRLDTLIQQLEDKSLENYGNDTADESSNNKCNEGNNGSNITENNRAAQKSTDQIVAEIQNRLNEARSNNEVLKILEEYTKYLRILESPLTEPDIQVENEAEKNKNYKNDSLKTVEESQTVKNTEQPKVKPLGTKFARKLKSVRPKLTYDSTECIDSIRLEESLNPLLLNDTILSGSHEDCIGKVQDLISTSPQLSKSHVSSHDHSYSLSHHSNENAVETQATKEEIIEKLQALIDAAKTTEEINRILDENDQYRYYLIYPFKEPELLKTPSKSPQKETKEKIIERIQNQLNTAEDSDTIHKILKENKDYLQYLLIPFIPPALDAQLSPTKPSQKDKPKSQNDQKQPLNVKPVNENNLNDAPNLERNTSRTELSFLLCQNFNVVRKKAAVPQPKILDENVIIDLIDDDDQFLTNKEYCFILYINAFNDLFEQI